MDVYRVDHVLGMETTQNFVAMRHRNPVLERLWNGERVEQVEILWEETLALEGPRRLLRRRGGAEGRHAEPHGAAARPRRAWSRRPTTATCNGRSWTW